MLEFDLLARAQAIECIGDQSRRVKGNLPARAGLKDIAHSRFGLQALNLSCRQFVVPSRSGSLLCFLVWRLR